MDFQDLGILLFGCSAVLLLGIPDSWEKWRQWKKWAPLLGLCGQPFWYWATWNDPRWGIRFVTVAFTLSWLNGVRLSLFLPWWTARLGRMAALRSANL